MAPLCFAYYCSGHGYGHATRVSAFACHLLSLPPSIRPTVYIVSSAPQHVFSDCITAGAVYRYAEIDPIIVQPLAYRVDRQKSIDVLKLFLGRKSVILEFERQWLLEIRAHAVLSDAAFLGCLAAKAAGIPSILITNFTFDSVYSYLSTDVIDTPYPKEQSQLAPNSSPTVQHQFAELAPDIPVSPSDLEPLVEQIHQGYRCAELLLLLPGNIPIPSFCVNPPLPSRDWVNVQSNMFHPNVIRLLTEDPSLCQLHPSIPFDNPSSFPQTKKPRSIISTPLIVRSPKQAPSVYTPEGRSRLLASIGVPIDLHDPERTKILVVSFGGQVFRKPSRSRSQSRNSSREPSPDLLPKETATETVNGFGISRLIFLKSAYIHDLKLSLLKIRQPSFPSVTPPRLSTPSHLWIPGAPPASKPVAVPTSPVDFNVPSLATIPPTPNESGYFDLDKIPNEFREPQLLPDPSWIAIVCGVSKDQWDEGGDNEDSGLPEDFFVAPKDIYMPDLTAMSDVLLGKLGYGTVSECVDSCTPFVYVSRPLFIEEHGLRHLLTKEGVGVELLRQSYEAGDWADVVEEAWARGRDSKRKKRADMAAGIVVDLVEMPDEEKVKVLRRHLVSKEERNNGHGEARSIADSDLEAPHVPDVGSSRRSSSGANAGPMREDSEPFPIPYHAPGADVTHDIYKWHADQRKVGRVRSVSFAGPSQQPDPAFEHIHEPGGFRRNYVILRATEQGVEEPRILNNFIDFLFIFGHFAGEDLEEDDDESREEDVEQNIAGTSTSSSTNHVDTTETTPLLKNRSRSKSRSRRRGNSVGPHGNATVTQAVLMLLKAFVGTGVLFLGKAFYNGGLLFSSVTFVFIAMISLYSFLLLVKTKFVVSGSFGEIGGTLYGPWMRYIILGSIVVSQMGFVAAYTIFVAQNLQAFVLGITHCLKLIPVQYFILSQLIIFLPLVLIRDLAKLSSTALIADAFILAGLIYIFGSEIKIVASKGIADIQLFNSKDFSLFIGTAVFSFEGIGLVIPITDAMREPHKFPAVLTGVMAFLTILFGGAGALAYMTFGSDVQTVVLVNLDSESKMVQSVQFIYSLAILLSVPLQLFPAVRILENGLFTRSGKADTRIKWYKNIFRFAMVMACTGISWVGAADLDKFVAFVGSFACVPLCYVYPAMLHYRACARTRKQKIADIVMIVFGLTAAAYTTTQTVRVSIFSIFYSLDDADNFPALQLMLEPATGPPRLGSCDPPN
ncbi:transmembrane amino acid transporter protein-domain-containing protein [Collybia nuda]|uniref:Transmembrane amino acid transporter protein-domain-containing protein n=1 Tax=Collybia nuda TaxID=64659 RepID=A0A9P5YD36_9AGAR|nr:transmembrane amino acid transporter protein-domain-containing protein [Collybia nuda]